MVSTNGYLFCIQLSMCALELVMGMTREKDVLNYSNLEGEKRREKVNRAVDQNQQKLAHIHECMLKFLIKLQAAI